MVSPLALLGGTPVAKAAWPETNTIGAEEKQAVLEVLETGILSQFRGVAGPDFLGGPRVRRLESDWSDYFGSRFAVSFNSLTSGLIAAIGAVGIGPGDEVIVTPTSMVASATCILMYGGIPVFADIDPNTLCLDPQSVERKITARTRAILVVHLFGYPADMNALTALADKHNLALIEDCAQAPAARTQGRWVGTLGSIGGFSLNYHKTIHSGEGGVMITDDARLAQRLQMIRNHGEAAVEAFGLESDYNTFGGNTRMTEIEAAIGICQLKKLAKLTEVRIQLAHKLDAALEGVPGLTPQRLKHKNDTHVYYMYPLRYDAEAWGLPRQQFVQAVCAEGIELREGYVRPIYWEPIFQQRNAFKGGFPFNLAEHIRYDRGLCPVAERMHIQELVFGKFCRWPLTDVHIAEAAAAIRKVYEHRHQIREHFLQNA